MTSPHGARAPRSGRWSTALTALTLVVLAVTASGLTALNISAGVAAGGLTVLGLGGTLYLVAWCLMPLAAMVGAVVAAHRRVPRVLPVLVAGSVLLALPVLSSATSYVDQPVADRNAMGGFFISVVLWLVVLATAAAAVVVEAVSRSVSRPPGSRPVDDAAGLHTGRPVQ